MGTDQRGKTRPFDGDSNLSAICDVGAFEAQTAFPGVLFFVINNNDSATISRNVNLTVTASANSQAVSFSDNGTSWLGWQPFPPASSPIPYQLPEGADGLRTVFVRVKDTPPGGTDTNVSATAKDDITLQRTVPAGHRHHQQ